MTLIRISLDEYRATTKPKRSKYGAKSAWRCQNCNAKAPAPEKRQKGKPAPMPIPCPVCGVGARPLHFDSRAEARRWDDLVHQQRAGLIRDLRRQVRYPLHATATDGETAEIGVYVADATYRDTNDNLVVEDVKGGKGGRATTTDLARWKFRHFEIEYGIAITIVS